MTRRPHLFPCLIAAAFLIAALGKWPYGYYLLLRWVTCACAAFTAAATYDGKRAPWTWLFGVVALLFNPIIPVYLSRQIWQPTDALAALLFLVRAALPIARIG